MGIAGLLGGAISMALGEYVSVSSQSDSQGASVTKEPQELADLPEEELEGPHRDRELREVTARQVAVELTEDDALPAHLSV